jgi:DNA-binding SARP family transcriptional activator
MPGEALLSPVAVLGARPALPFTLETRSTHATALETPRPDLIQVILNRLDLLQAISERSQLELTNLRELNAEILQAVNQRPAAPLPAPDIAVDSRPAVNQKLTLFLLGPFEARVGDRPVASWPGRKARQLLAYLALEKGRMVPKDVLIELFWPGARADRGANNLSIAIYQIRSSLAAVSREASEAITVRQGLYGIEMEGVGVDLWDLQAHLDQARRALERDDKPSVRAHLKDAVALCRGELMASDPYEEWTAEPRRRFNAAWHQALAWLATEASTQREWPSVVDYAGQILGRDACDEGAHRMIVNAHLMMGNRSLALQQYRACVEILRRELGVHPSPETLKLGEELED